MTIVFFSKEGWKVPKKMSLSFQKPFWPFEKLIKTQWLTSKAWIFTHTRLKSNSDVSIGDTERWAGGCHYTSRNQFLNSKLPWCNLILVHNLVPWGYAVVLKLLKIGMQPRSLKMGNFHGGM